MAIQIKTSSTSNASSFKINDKGNYQLNEQLTISATDHDSLVKYCLARMDAGVPVQEAAVDRYKSIDKEIAGYILLSDADRQRKADVEEGKGLKPYDINLQTVRTQLHESITYILGVFFPPEGPYSAIAKAEKQDVAKGLSMLMNEHAQTYKHYTATAKGLFDAMKYNMGMWSIEWDETRGVEIKNDSAGQFQEVPQSVLQSGNNLNYLDPYNTIIDPSVHPTQVNELGEFFASVEIITEFRAMRLEAMGSIFNLNRRKKDRITVSYYTEKPDILGDASKGNGSDGTDWFAVLSRVEGNNVLLKDAIELVTINIWLPVDAFGIEFKDKGNKNKSGYQIWRLTIANASIIVRADPLPNAHGYLPIIITMPWDDNFERQTQGFAEILLPYQRFASFQMNTHQHSQRKKLYGLTFYDQLAFPNFPNIDASGKIPFNPTGEKFDINKAIKQVFDAPDTENTLRDIASMDDLMQKVLPTQQAQQVASLERATQYQAAATVQSGNRRNLFLAVLIDEQAFMVGRKIQLYNIMQFQKEVEVFDKEGNSVKINPAELRDGKFEFLVGSGLRGLDKIVIQETLSNILFAIIQSPQATAQIDVVALMNYITSTMGDFTDLNQFKFKNEFDALTPEQKQQAFQLLQSALQAQGNEQNASAPVQ